MIVMSINKAQITDVYGIRDIRVNLPYIFKIYVPLIIALLNRYKLRYDREPKHKIRKNSYKLICMKL